MRHRFTPTTTRTGGRRFAAGLGLALSAGLVLSGCSSPAEQPSPEPSASAAAAAVDIPSSPQGERVRWFLELLNGEDDVTAADLEPVLSEEFQQSVPAKDLAEQLNAQFRPAKPFVPTAYEELGLTATVTVAGAIAAPFELELTVDETDTVVGMFLRPVAEP